jgi:hypothetical protein
MFKRSQKSSAVQEKTARTARGSAAMMEGLEGRQFFSVTGTSLDNGVLTVNGDNNADTIKVVTAYSKPSDAISNPSSGTLQIYDRGTLRTSMRMTSITRVVLNGNGGDDVLDCRGVSLPVVLNGGAGADALYGGNRGDFLDGGIGRDVLAGFAGDDQLWDMSGDDSWIDGGTGNDTLIYLNVDPRNGYLSTHEVHNVEIFQATYAG